MASGESTAESTSREAIVRRSFLERPAPETESGSFSNWTRKASYASSSSRLAPAPPLEAFRLVCLPLRMVHQYVLELRAISGYNVIQIQSRQGRVNEENDSLPRSRRLVLLSGR